VAFLEGRLLSSQSEQSEKFSKSLDWLEKSRPSLNVDALALNVLIRNQIETRAMIKGATRRGVCQVKVEKKAVLILADFVHTIPSKYCCN